MKTLWNIPQEYYQIEHQRRAFPVLPTLAKKSKGEAPKCKTCQLFYRCTKSHGPMTMACERYERKKKK